MQDITQQLARLQLHTAGIADLMTSVRAHAPASASGWDPTRSVQITIDAMGLPTAVSIEDEWEDEVAPNALGGAVLAAYSAAVSDGMTAWSAALDQSDWQTKIENLGARAASGTPAAPAAPAVVAPSTAPPADLDNLVEEVIGTLRATRTRASSPAATVAGSGAGGGGRVKVQLSSAGLTGCAIDPSWGRGQHADTLVSAITAAFLAARADLEAGVGTDGPATAAGVTRAGATPPGSDPTPAERFASGALTSDALAALFALTAAPGQPTEDSR